MKQLIASLMEPPIDVFTIAFIVIFILFIIWLICAAVWMTRSSIFLRMQRKHIRDMLANDWQDIMFEKLRRGEEVTVYDHTHSYLSYHVIKIGFDKYYPVLKMKHGQVLVDHVIKKRFWKQTQEIIPGTEYEKLCQREKNRCVWSKLFSKTSS